MILWDVLVRVVVLCSLIWCYIGFCNFRNSVQLFLQEKNKPLWELQLARYRKSFGDVRVLWWIYRTSSKVILILVCPRNRSTCIFCPCDPFCLFLMQFRAAIQLQFDFHRAIYNLGTVLVCLILSILICNIMFQLWLYQFSCFI